MKVVKLLIIFREVKKISNRVIHGLDILRTTMDREPMDYASSGVDIDAEGAAVASLVGALSSSVRRKGEFGAPVPLAGGFGGIIEFGEHRLACLLYTSDAADE